jgi:LysM repeat protein
MKTATTPVKNVCSKAIALAVMVTASLTVVGAGLLASAQAQQTEAARTVATGSGIPLATDAPDRYTVKRGDTLWDISKVFLRDPWYWPEIWYVNPQVKNPHRIYPGDVLVLVKGGAQPQVTIAERGPEGAAAEAAAEQPTSSAAPAAEAHGNGVTKLSPQIRYSPISAAVTTVSYDTIKAFLGRPTLMNDSEVKSGPYIVALRDTRLVGGAGDEVYARGIPSAVENTRFNVMHIVEPLRDPENDKMLGYRGIYAGTGSLVTTGDPAKLTMQDVDREVLRGDKLFPEHVAVELDFLPRAPAGDIKGAIMTAAGVQVGGALEVVAINRGGKHGLEPGHVLAIYQKGDTVTDRFSGGSTTGDGYSGERSGKTVKLPDERVGLLMVFKTYEQMSYALIMEASRPVRNGDMIRTP